MSQEIWVKKSQSFPEAQSLDARYYLNMSAEERLEIVQFLREQYLKLKELPPMKVEKDYEELLKFFNERGVKYCIVGSFALAFYARPRYTKDMDILVEPTVENAGRIIASLNDFGFGSLALTENDFTEKGQIIQLGYEPVRVDIITSKARQINKPPLINTAPPLELHWI
jgi:hypothetical protein